MAATTATSAPGIRRLTRRSPSTRTITHAETATATAFIPDRPVTSSTTLSGSEAPGVRIPSMSPSWPAATWMPTPVRNPTSTVRERKSARKPSRASRASSRSAATSNAAAPASWT